MSREVAKQSVSRRFCRKWGGHTGVLDTGWTTPAIQPDHANLAFLPSQSCLEKGCELDSPAILCYTIMRGDRVNTREHCQARSSSLCRAGPGDAGSRRSQPVRRISRLGSQPRVLGHLLRCECSAGDRGARSQQTLRCHRCISGTFRQAGHHRDRVQPYLRARDGRPAYQRL